MKLIIIINKMLNLQKINGGGYGVGAGDRGGCFVFPNRFEIPQYAKLKKLIYKALQYFKSDLDLLINKAINKQITHLKRFNIS